MNSKDNGLMGIGNAHKKDSFLTFKFASGSILQLPFTLLREAVNVGVWYVGNVHIRIIEINGLRSFANRKLNHIPHRGYMVLCYNGNSSMIVDYTISRCNCSVCEGTNLTLGKQIENEHRWVNPNAI
jgi:hypothetical protein